MPQISAKVSGALEVAAIVITEILFMPNAGLTYVHVVLHGTCVEISYSAMLNLSDDFKQIKQRVKLTVIASINACVSYNHVCLLRTLYT